MSLLQRKFLQFYARYGSIEIAAETAKVSGRHVYRWKRTIPWFRRRCELALEAYLDRIEGTIAKKAVDEMELAALTFVARHRIPAYQPMPKEIAHKHTGQPPQNVSISSTSIAFGHFTDEEIETLDRLLMKAGIPEQLLNPAPAPPIDVEPVKAQK